MHKMFAKNDKREKSANEYRKAILDETKHKQDKYKSRRLHAKELISKQVEKKEKDGVKIYT